MYAYDELKFGTSYSCSATPIEINLVRALSLEVARRVVVAGDEDAAVVADDAGAADGGGVTPHHLRVVAARLVRRRRAGVAVVVVPLLLRHPQADGVRRRPVSAGAAHEDVLAVAAAAGVLERAVAGALGRVALRERGHVVVPRHRADADVGPRRVVQVHKVLRRVLRRARRDEDAGGCHHGERQSEARNLLRHC